MNILTILGSLRKGSINRMILQEAMALAPKTMTFDASDISQFPLYNQDMENVGIPNVVLHFKEQIRQADGLLFATPEYNYSMPGVLKNAIDWASRPPKDNSFNGKPCAIMTAGTGMGGGAKAQYHFRQSCVFVNLIPMNKPEIVIPKAMEKFDANGTLSDEVTMKKLIEFMASFQQWV
ncbi:MAG TPA: NADPH-dependent FMN reductase, partial [Candidatus Kapabacteria bacterium]